MKYNEKNIKRIVKAIENHPFHIFWNVHFGCRFDEMEHCEICFEALDGYKMSFVICGGEIIAFSNGMWRGSCVMENATSDTLFMWIGCKLDQMYKLNTDI